jgi:hypothetical protein
MRVGGAACIAPRHPKQQARGYKVPRVWPQYSQVQDYAGNESLRPREGGTLHEEEAQGRGKGPKCLPAVGVRVILWELGTVSVPKEQPGPVGPLKGTLKRTPSHHIFPPLYPED